VGVDVVFVLKEDRMLVYVARELGLLVCIFSVDIFAVFDGRWWGRG